MSIAAVAVLTDPRTRSAVAQEIARRLAPMRVVQDLETVPCEEIRYLVAYQANQGVFNRLPKLQLICCTGAGVDRLLSAPDFPPNVPITRVVDPVSQASIAEYAIYFVLRELRGFGDYERLQQAREWKQLPGTLAAETTVGILGLGNIGSEVAKKFLALGFKVVGWSRSPRTMESVQCFHGEDGLKACLSASRFLFSPQETCVRDDSNHGVAGSRKC